MATMAAKELTIRLPRPHGRQIAFRNSKAKRKVVCAGRRGGKTTGMAILAVEAMLAGRRILEAAPIADQTDSFWQACCQALAEPIAAGLVKKNETNRILELTGVPVALNAPPNPNLLEKLQVEVVPRLPRIRCKTAHDADSLRGDYADILILDEFSLMDKSAWEEVGAPMLLDNNGDAVFIFTPQSLNHAHTLYQRAVSDTSGRWEAFHFTSLENPYLSREALAEITQDMTESAYKQEILAEFLQGEGAVFRNVEACLKAPHSTPEQHRGHRVALGGDWAQKKDFTAFSVGCLDCKVELELMRFNKIEWALQRGRLIALVEKWNVREILLELNSIGSPNFEALIREGLSNGRSVRGFETTASSKPPLIQSLALALERAEFQWLPDAVGKGELLAYESKIGASGRPQYSAPEGMNDDTVIGRALLNWIRTSGGQFAQGTFFR
jgi:hypothetical protein